MIRPEAVEEPSDITCSNTVVLAQRIVRDSTLRMTGVLPAHLVTAQQCRRVLAAAPVQALP